MPCTFILVNGDTFRSPLLCIFKIYNYVLSQSIKKQTYIAFSTSVLDGIFFMLFVKMDGIPVLLFIHSF